MSYMAHRARAAGFGQVQQKSLAQEARRLPRQATVAGLPADAFIRIAAPLFTGGLSALGLIYSIQGRHGAATGLALTGVLISSFVAVGQAVHAEERALQRGRGG